MEHEKSLTAASTWPGAFGAYKPSAEAVKRNVNTFLMLWALAIVASIVAGAIFGHSPVGSLLSGLIGAYFGVGQVIAVMASLRGQRIELDAVIKQSWPLFLPMFVLQLLVGATLTFAFLLFVIPFFIVLPRLSLAAYFLVDNKLGIIEAFKASWHATKGHSGKVWGIIGVSLLMVLPVVTLIGIALTIYWLFLYQAVLGLLYLHVAKK
jgi:hypothetical protein